MATNKNDKVLTILILIFSVAGLIYFGISAIRSDSNRASNNPYEYNIDDYRQSGADQVTYEEIKTLVLQLQKPHAMTVDPRDRIYITEGAHVFKIDENDHLVSSAVAIDDINALDVTADGDIYAVTRSAVEVLDSTGVRKSSWQIAGTRTVLTSIAIQGQDVYLADAGNRIVWRYDRNGTLLNKIGEKDAAKDIPGFVIPSPYFDVAIDPDGFLWAINTGRHQFENYMPDGTLRSFWSQSSMSIEGFSGCCNPVHVAIMSDGSFVTSEKGLLRIKIYKPIGEFDTVVATPDQFDSQTSELNVALNSKGQILVLDPQRAQVRFFQKKDPHHE